MKNIELFNLKIYLSFDTFKLNLFVLEKLHVRHKTAK